MTTGTPTREPDTEEKARQEHKEEKFTEVLKNIRKEDVVDYAKNNTTDTIAYGLLLLGIILLLFAPHLGQVLVGAVAGYYFGDEVFHFIKHLRIHIDEQPIVRSLIFAGVCLALFIEAPLIFITAILIAGLKQLIGPRTAA